MGKSEQKERVREFTALLKARLSKKRYMHSVNVARAAYLLAERWGADADRAYIAGLLHDCCKELSYDEQRELMEGGFYEVSEIEWQCKPVWHGIAAASFMHAELGIDDEEILSAARWHTVGHGGMTRIEEVVYMADLVSAERSYRDVEHFRKLAQNDLQQAMLEALAFSITSVVKKGTPLPVSTVEAYNRYLSQSMKKAAKK